MSYIRIDKCNSANGPGVRTVVWFAGCNHVCEGCHNKETWNPNQGNEITDKVIEEIIDTLKPEYIDGLTLSGGDPLFPGNRNETLRIAKEVKTKFPDKEIWLWTGYLWEDVKNLSIMNYIDVLIDGPFILKDRNITLKYKGSPNQRVIDVKESLAKNSIILKDD